MENWRDNLPDELKNSASLQKFKSESDLATSYIELERRSGRSLTIPGEDATDDAWDKYYSKAQESGHLTVHPDHADGEHSAAFWSGLGVPEDTKGYTVKEGFDSLPDDYIENVRGVAKAAGWTKKQFRDTLDEFATEYAAQTEATETAINDDKGIVSGKWGMAEESKKSAISALVSKYQDPDHPLGELNSAAYLMLDNIVKDFTGKGPQSHGQPSGGDQYTPSELDEMISDITTKMVKQGRKMGKEKYNALMAKRHRLQEMRSKAA